MTLEELLADPPRVHDWIPGQLIASGLPREAFQYIHDHTGPASRTLETGAGISTMVFALRRARHTCVAPDPDEIDRLRRYAAERGIAVDSIDFQVQRSDQFFHAREVGELDLVLVDGCHGFPSPFLDWFYTAAKLRVGGILVVDDVQIWTGAVLRDFLAAEPEWRLIAPHSAKTAIFEKVADYVPWKEWNAQPYVHGRSQGEASALAASPLGRALEMVRAGQGRALINKALRRLRESMK